jgi:hypothetical protein
VIAGADGAAVRRNAETHSELLHYVAPGLDRPVAPVILAAAARSVEISSARGTPIWLSADGAVHTAGVKRSIRARGP